MEQALEETAGSFEAGQPHILYAALHVVDMPHCIWLINIPHTGDHFISQREG